MNQKTLTIIAVLVVAGIIGAYLFAPASVGTFTGTTAKLHKISYNGVDYTPSSETYAVVDIPKTYWTDLDSPVGIAVQIAGQPQTIARDEKEPIIVDMGGSFDGYRWEYRTVEFGIDFQCTGEGTLSPTGMEFWVRLANNYDSVWVDDAESLGYVTEAWVKEYEILQNGLYASILPSAQGAFFQLYDTGAATVNPPEAFSEVLKIEELRNFQTVDIKFQVDHFRPAVTPASYEAAHVYVTVNARVLVLGHWVNIVPEHFQGPAPDQGYDFIGEFLNFLNSMVFDYFELILISVVIIAVVVIVVKFK